MTRDTARQLKSLDMTILQAALVLDHFIRDRVQLDLEGTEKLVAEITKTLTRSVHAKETKPT